MRERATHALIEKHSVVRRFVKLMIPAFVVFLEHIRKTPAGKPEKVKFAGYRSLLLAKSGCFKYTSGFSKEWSMYAAKGEDG